MIDSFLFNTMLFIKWMQRYFITAVYYSLRWSQVVKVTLFFFSLLAQNEQRRLNKNMNLWA